MPLRAIYLVLALALCGRSQPATPHPPLSVVSAWMIFSIDSFVHPCRQICTCNQSPVDTGLITVLIWHPAAFLVLARTHTSSHSSGGISEIKNEPSSPWLLRGSLQSSADEAEDKGFSRSGRQKGTHQICSDIVDDSLRLCHRGRYRCLPNPPACLLWSAVFTPGHARPVSP